MHSEEVWYCYGNEVYAFIVSRIKDEDVSKDILQNTFLKVHNSLEQLKSSAKARSWVFQIARNEIINAYNERAKNKRDDNSSITSDAYAHICCWDDFISELPPKYREVVQLVFIRGLQQSETAEALNISLANVKARIRRAKHMLKTALQTCCQYDLNKTGKLIGESDCIKCVHKTIG